MRNLIYAMAILVAGSVAISEAAEISRPESEKILAAANEKMEMAGATKIYEEAEGLLRGATQDYLRLIQSGCENGYLYYNLGNCDLRLHEIGEAIYWYRMAERLIPQDRQLRANLRYARTQIRVKFPPPPASEILRTILFFHFIIPFNIRLTLFLFFWNMFWVLLIFGFYLPAFRRRWLRAMFLAGLLSFGLSSGWDLYRDRVSEEGVIIQDDVVVRKGSASTYDPAFTEPLSPGIEIDILLKSDRYIQVQFTNGTTGWVPSTSLRALGPRPSF